MEQAKALVDESQVHSDQIIIELRNQLCQYESQTSDKVNQTHQQSIDLDNLQVKLKITQQQSKFYESEVQNLRCLLQSYDDEFKLGKPEPNKMNRLRDDYINTLRQDLDRCRSEVTVLLSESAATKRSGDDGDQVKQLTDQVQELQVQQTKLQNQLSRWQLYSQDLEGFSHTDFVPTQTKVSLFRDEIGFATNS